MTKGKSLIKKVTLDSSVIVSYLLKEDKNNARSSEIWERISKEELEVIIPTTVLVEVAGAVRRRTGSESLAKEICNNLLQIDSFIFIDLNIQRSKIASEIASETGLKGMDAIVVQISKEFNTELITFDKEMLAKVSS